jgi:hypothetical protein
MNDPNKCINANATNKCINPTWVRVNWLGTFTFNSSISRLLREKNIRYLYLLWDAGSRTVAFRATDQYGDGSYKLSGCNGQLSVCAPSFLGHIGLSLESSIRLSATWNEAEKMLELEPITRKK